MERVIHQFSVGEDIEVSLVVVVDGAGPRIEWRRYGRQATGGAVAEDRFPIRLAWIPFLIEGLTLVEETFHQIQSEIEVGAAEAGAPPAIREERPLIVIPGQPEQLPQEVVLTGPAPQPDPSARVQGRYPRFVIRAPLIVAVQSKDLTGPRIITGDAVDISWGGIQAHLPSLLKPGTVLEVLLGLGGKKTLRLPARVVWGRPGEGLGHGKPHGLEFLPADPRLRQLVEQYLTLLAQGTRTEL